ncbi:MAG: hypothetical protein AAGA54_25030 [Myxococcota bacterium]
MFTLEPVSRTSKAAAVAVTATGALLAGVVLPLERGWGLPLGMLALACLISLARDWKRGSIDFTTLGPARWAAAALVVVASAVFVAAAGTAMASLIVAFPGAAWALPVLVLGAVISSRVGERARLPTAIAMALLVPAAGVLGARHEAAGPNARGWAHSGPIHGIHPFQITAVAIDGYGPFDIPFNDYIEPDGNRGYTPQTYADAMERALHRIAELHFADGPARGYRAFAQAEVEAVVTPAVEETVGVSVGTDEHPRIIVRSGSWGQHSQVTFVCPGKRDDPRGPQPDKLLSRMCPNKYASEASAGLGVTGRWPGYVESRGMPRVGLAPWNAWTRADPDEATAAAIALRERRFPAWGWAAFGVFLLGAVVSRRVVTFGAPRVTAAVAVAGVVAAAVMVFETQAGVGAVGFIETPPSWSQTGLLAWTPLLLVFAGMPELRQRAVRANTAWAGVAVLLGTAGVAAVVARLRWAVPDLVGVDASGLESWVLGLADLLARTRGLDVFEAEHGIAAMTVALLGGAVLAIFGRAATSLAERGPGLERVPAPARVVVAGVAIFALAAALIFSRKTFGAATLVPGAIGLTAVLHSGVAWVRRGGPLSAGVLLVTVGVAATLSYGSIARSSHPSNGFVLLFASVGVLAALGGLAFFAARRSTSA